jgi:hypothetical protein
MLRKLCSLSLALLSILPAAAAGEGSEKKPGEKTTAVTMFIPGIRQLQTGKYVKGTLFLCSFIGTAAGAFIYNKKGSDWYEKYRDSTNVDEITRFRAETEKSFKKRNLFMVGIFTVWLAHIIDLEFFKSKKTGVKGEVGKNSVNIGFYYCF